MTTTEAHAIISRAFPTLRTGDRHPNGWSFFDGEPQRGPNSNRIVRVIAKSSTAAAELKLSISSRLEKKNVVSRRFSEAELRKQVAKELKLYRENFV